MPGSVQQYYPDCPEVLVVSLARDGDAGAFEELVRRRQSWLRNLMRRLCGDAELADGLARQVFVEMWIAIRSLKKAKGFSEWLRRLAVKVWIERTHQLDQRVGKGKVEDGAPDAPQSPAEPFDLDKALGKLSGKERLCVVLSYREGMTRPDIAELTGFPPDAVESSIEHGAARLAQMFAATVRRAGRYE